MNQERIAIRRLVVFGVIAILGALIVACGASLPTAEQARPCLEQDRDLRRDGGNGPAAKFTDLIKLNGREAPMNSYELEIQFNMTFPGEPASAFSKWITFEKTEKGWQCRPW